MKFKGGVQRAIKKFDHDISAQEAIICDAAGEKTSNDPIKF